jgi:hypothetical protein
MTRQIPGKLGSSPDTSPVARIDVEAAMASKLSVDNALQRENPDQVRKALVQRHDDLDAHQKSAAATREAIKARFAGVESHGAGGGRGVWANADPAAQTAAALGLATVRKERRTPDTADDPTGASQTLATLKRLYEGGSSQLQRTPVAKAKLRPLKDALGRMLTLGDRAAQKRRVRKAQSSNTPVLSIYDVDGNLLGFLRPGDLDDKGEIGEVVYDVHHKEIGFAHKKDVIDVRSFDDADPGPNPKAALAAARAAASATKTFVPSPAPAEDGTGVQRISKDGGRTYETVRKSQGAFTAPVVRFHLGDRLVRTERQ